MKDNFPCGDWSTIRKYSDGAFPPNIRFVREDSAVLLTMQL